MKNCLHLAWSLLLLAIMANPFFYSKAEELPLSQRAANAAIDRWPNGRFAPTDDARPSSKDQLGILLQGMDAVWLNTADARYFDYIKTSIDQLVRSDGSIRTLDVQQNHLENIALGKQFLLLYGVTGNERYLKAAILLFQQLAQQRRNLSGANSRQNDPKLAHLEGLHFADPFYAEYASISHHPEAFNDITQQFALTHEHAGDAKARRQLLKTTVASDMKALVDTLDYFPKRDVGRAQLITLLQEDAAAVARYQDGATGLWSQVIDKPRAKENLPEGSASCLFVYALAKGVRRGYLPSSYGANAERGYNGILRRFINRSNSIDQETHDNNPTAVGAFLLASVEMENAQNARLGRGDTVAVDAWFNSQKRTDAFGRQVYFHYKWDDLSNNGFSLLGNLFKNFGADTETIYTEPRFETLRRAQVFIIASPDIPVKNPNPHYMQANDAAEIARWVKAGGVLVMLENDPANADIDHLNLLAEKFGIHYNDIVRNHVDGSRWEMGKISIDAGGTIFNDPHTIYMKDTCTISVTPPAVAELRVQDDIFMAIAKYGKGMVFATVDPWLYNEYTDGRKLPAEYDNYAAGKELVRWILLQAPPAANRDKDK